MWTEFRAPPRQVLLCAPGTEQMVWTLVRMSAHTILVLISFPSLRHFKLSLSRTKLSNPHLPHFLNMTLLTNSHFSERSQHPISKQTGNMADSSFSLIPTVHESLSPTPATSQTSPWSSSPWPLLQSTIIWHLAKPSHWSPCLGIPWWLRW